MGITIFEVDISSIQAIVKLTITPVQFNYLYVDYSLISVNFQSNLVNEVAVIFSKTKYKNILVNCIFKFTVFFSYLTRSLSSCHFTLNIRNKYIYTFVLLLQKRVQHFMFKYETV